MSSESRAHVVSTWPTDETATSYVPEDSEGAMRVQTSPLVVISESTPSS